MTDTTTTAHCNRCDCKTPHRHMHDAAHGISGTHMAGTERYECVVCGTRIYATEGVAKGLRFILDKPHG